MMTTRRLRTAVACTMLGLLPATITACQSGGGYEEEDYGTIAGAGLGALAGAAIGDGAFGGLVGAVIGGVAGREIGQRIEDDDRNRIATALNQDEPVRWTNPNTSAGYLVQPGGVVAAPAGASGPCRRFTMEFMGSARVDRVNGVACREAGTWRVWDLNRA